MFEKLLCWSLICPQADTGGVQWIGMGERRDE